MKRGIGLLIITSLVQACASHGRVAESGPDHATLAKQLSATERAFSDSAASTSAADGMARMFDNTVRLVAGPRIVVGADSALAMLRTNPLNVANRASWQTARVGISADGSHGFSIGYMDVGKDTIASRAKFLAYWERRNGNWKVIAYKRNVRQPGPLPSATLAPSLPLGGRSTSTSHSEALASLRAAEVAFSDSAQRSIDDAFFYFAAPDANHFGSPNDVGYITGPSAIRNRNGGAPPPAGVKLAWEISETIVAPSGDLGVNLGFVTITRPGQPPAQIPFMTVWRRNSEGQWRFIAE